MNGRTNNLEYGSYAPGAPKVFIDEDVFVGYWRGVTLYYLLADTTQLEHLQRLAGAQNLHQVAAAGGKFLFSNQPVRPVKGIQPTEAQILGSMQGLW